MGVADLVSAFNLVGGPAGLSCNKALLTYVRKDAKEFQRLAFSGTDSAGVAFEIKSDLIRPGGDLIRASRDTAQMLLDQRKQESPP